MFNIELLRYNELQTSFFQFINFRKVLIENNNQVNYSPARDAEADVTDPILRWLDKSIILPTQQQRCFPALYLCSVSPNINIIKLFGCETLRVKIDPQYKVFPMYWGNFQGAGRRLSQPESWPESGSRRGAKISRGKICGWRQFVGILISMELHSSQSQHDGNVRVML